MKSTYLSKPNRISFRQVDPVPLEKKEVPMYDLMSTHTARRSFITHMLNSGVPAKAIMAITGHKSINNFQLSKTGLRNIQQRIGLQRIRWDLDYVLFLCRAAVDYCY